MGKFAVHPDDREPSPAVRPNREDLAAALRLALDAAQPIRASSTPDETGSYHQQLVTLEGSGWVLLVMWQQRAILHLSEAWGPSGCYWEYGCERYPSWDAGPESVVFCPIRHLLTPLEQAALEARLLAAPCSEQPLAAINAPEVDEIMSKSYMELFTA